MCIKDYEGQARFSEEVETEKNTAATRFSSLGHNKYEVMLIILSFPWHNPIVHAHVIINVQWYPSSGSKS